MGKTTTLDEILAAFARAGVRRVSIDFYPPASTHPAPSGLSAWLPTASAAEAAAASVEKSLFGGVSRYAAPEPERQAPAPTIPHPPADEASAAPDATDLALQPPPHHEPDIEVPGDDSEGPF